MFKQLRTSPDDLHAIATAAGNARKNSKEIKVPLAALSNMIQDHSTMLLMLEGLVKEGPWLPGGDGSKALPKGSKQG